VLAEIPGVEIVGTATDGKVALSKIAQLKPDMLTLDFEMPEMDGLEVLERIGSDYPGLKVVMVSSHTREGASVTLKALALGALTFITKPDGDNPLDNKDILLAQLSPIIHEIIGQILPNESDVQGAPPGPSLLSHDATLRKAPPSPEPGPIQIVAIGISTGGPNALAELIPSLPDGLRVPVVIVQHMPSKFTAALADSLDQKSALKVVEATDMTELAPGTVYLAPGGKQMRVVHNAGKFLLEVNDDPPENHCQPSVDYLFRSVAKIYDNHALGVIMTGMGADGVLGLRLMKRKGAQVIAQDKQSCIVFGMPSEAINAGVVDIIIPLTKIASEIVKRVGP